MILTYLMESSQKLSKVRLGDHRWVLHGIARAILINMFHDELFIHI